jgi:hypothetical protein
VTGRPLIAAALAAAAVVAAFLARGRIRAHTVLDTDSDAHESSRRREWRCQCGQEYVVSGVDRHRVYWPAGASPDDPVLDLVCVECGAPLPATREVSAAR